MARLRGTTMVLLLVALTVACDKGGPTAPSPITEPPVTPVEPTEITITVELPYPEDANGIHIRVGISEATVTCLIGCEGRPTEVTDRQGEVTFIGRPPLTIRAEKSGHITVEHQTYGGRVNMGHEWPPELDIAIRQLGLGNAIASGELSLIWEDEVYFGNNILD